MVSPQHPMYSKTNSKFDNSSHLLKCPCSASLPIPTHFSTAKHDEEREGWRHVVKHRLAYSCSVSLFLGWCTGLQLELSNPISEIFQRRGSKVGHPLSFDRAELWHQTTLQESSLWHLNMCHTINHDFKALLTHFYCQNMV